MKKVTKKAVKRPQSVDIGGMKYKLVYATKKSCPDLKGKHGSEYYGAVCPRKHTIFIDKRCGTVEPFVLFHEIFHACIDALGVPEWQDEEIIRPLTHMIFNSMKQVGLLSEKPQ